MRNGENTAQEHSETGILSSVIGNLRSSLAGRALQLLLLAAACTPDRAGTHQIEIKGDPMATAALEELRREFERVSQLPRQNELAIQEILAERRQLLREFNIDGDTETWTNGNDGDGPRLKIAVDEAACARAKRCRLVKVTKR